MRFTGQRSVIGTLVTGSLSQFQSQIEEGALIVLDETRTRARLLPLKQ